MNQWLSVPIRAVVATCCRVNAWLERPAVFAGVLTLALAGLYLMTPYYFFPKAASQGIYPNKLFWSVIILDRMVLLVLILSGIWVAVKGSIKPIFIFGALVFAAVEAAAEPVLTFLHSSILNYVPWVYSIFFWRDLAETSNEHARLIIMFSVLLALTIQQAIARWRTLDRTFVLIALVCVCGTFFVFHTANLIQFKNYRDNQRQHMEAAFASLHPPAIERICEAQRYDCHVATLADLEAGNGDAAPVVKKVMQFIPKDVLVNETGHFYYVLVVPGNPKVRAGEQVIPVFAEFVPTFVRWDRSKGTLLVVQDYASYWEYIMLCMRIQVPLIVIAHGTWFILFLALWLFHRRKLNDRSRMRD